MPGVHEQIEDQRHAVALCESSVFGRRAARFAAFGEALPGSFVRVELMLIENDAQAKMAPHIRSGERVTVRLHRREQRVITLVFEFVRKWLGQ
mgnify:CR=1 FL=1